MATGSAADAQHLAAELVGRQNYDRARRRVSRRAFRPSVLTAISNDPAIDAVFARQVQRWTAGDILVGISTSGRSKTSSRPWP